jgi:hypothetical protein
MTAMPWWDILKRKTDDAATQPHQPRPQVPMATHEALAGHQQLQRRSVDPDDPDIRERQRKRLIQKVQNLQYDVQQAEDALVEPNRWTTRVEQLTQAIDQARSDSEAILHAPPGFIGVALPEWPISIDNARAVPPADISMRVGDVPFRYREEIDWSERGHQKAPVQLQRIEGDLEVLLPNTTPTEQRDVLRDHLAHSLSILVEQIREDALDGKPLPQTVLADLARPCTDCGGWLDYKGRCPACQERQWKSDALRADAERLIRERNETLDDLQRLRDRLPLLRRQLADARTALAAIGESLPESPAR